MIHKYEVHLQDFDQATNPEFKLKGYMAADGGDVYNNVPIL